MKIVIIEDEQFTVDDLSETLQKIDENITISAILKSVKEAIAYFENNEKPDLIFCDIQLGDGLSFDIFKKIRISTPIIFCTAFDEYALQAFKTNGIDYILKPFSKKTLEESLSKFNTLKNVFSKDTAFYETITNLLENKNKSKQTSILVYQKDNIIPIKIDKISLFFIKNEITHLQTFTNEKYTINKSLDDLEIIAGKDFFRVNRQFLVNRKAIKTASQYFSRKLLVNLTVPFNEQIIISKEKSTAFIDWLSVN
ncbi:MAG: response regulator transcription factor [Bacteroidales bacterium]|nr:response regulator transcription factor [Bacteroidales bacterium]